MDRHMSDRQSTVRYSPIIQIPWMIAVTIVMRSDEEFDGLFDSGNEHGDLPDAAD